MHVAPETSQPVPEQAALTQRALFLDRDGIINEEVGYLVRPEDVRFVPGIFSLCRAARDLGYKIFVVTNQSGIARGYYTEEEFHHLMHWIQLAFAREGTGFDAVYHCPFHPEHGVGVYRIEHEDRKPSPGMLLRAAREFGIALEQSVLVGDRCTDILAANTAGLAQAFLLAGTETAECKGRCEVVYALEEVERWLTLRGAEPASIVAP